MTPAARSCAHRAALACAARLRRSALRSAAAVALSFASGSIARAEVGASLSIANEDRFRGQSVSDGRPTATAMLSYDDVRGPYLGASSTVVLTRSNGLQPLRQIVYGGFAQRLTSELTVDIGATARRFSRYSSAEYARHLNEFYVGVLTRTLGLRVYYSPSYGAMHGSATYGELNALLLTRKEWSLTGHLGLLSLPRVNRYVQAHPEADWRLGATRRIGRLGFSVSWVGATPRQYSNRWRGGILLSADRSF